MYIIRNFTVCFIVIISLYVSYIQILISFFHLQAASGKNKRCMAYRLDSSRLDSSRLDSLLT